jgi:hypothetical protein
MPRKKKDKNPVLKCSWCKKQLVFSDCRIMFCLQHHKEHCKGDCRKW